MKIQNINNKNNYINHKNNSNFIKKEEINRENKYDVIDIKPKSIKNDENISPQSIKKKIVSQINEETNADKINRIKENINNKTYDIDVEEIVRRLLG